MARKEPLSEAEQALAGGQPAIALSILDSDASAAESATGNNLRGRALVSMGRRAEAKRAFEIASHLDPGFDRAWTNLAKLEAEEGRFAEALGLLEQGLIHCPNSTRLRRAAANASLRTGRPADAVAHLEQLVSLEPTLETWRRLGDARSNAGEASAAVDAYLRAAQCGPLSLDLLLELHSAALPLGRSSELASSLAEATLEFSDPQELCTVASIAYDCAVFQAAETAARKALSMDPQFDQAILALASTQTALGRDQEAEQTLRASADVARTPAVVLELVRRRRLANDPDEAWRLLESTVARYPDDPRVLVAYAEDARQRLLKAEGLRMLLRAVELAPRYADARSELAHELVAFRRVPEAIEHARTALRLRPDVQVYHSTLLFDAHYVEALPADVAEAHRQFGRKFGYARPVKRREAVLDPERPLRIGYVSSDFRDHSVAYFIEPLLKLQSHGTNRVYCYSTSDKKDAITERFRQLPLEFRDVAVLTNASIAELVAGDEIDILIDLGGLTNHERFGIFTRRPAPVQMTYLGYPDTTGLDCFDYRLTDAVADPPGESERLHTERLLRMPKSAWCFHAGHDVPVGEAIERPPVFACFNFLPKITDELASAWSQILERVPGARLVLKSALLADPEAQRQVVAGLERCGLDPARVDFLGWLPTRLDHLRFHDTVDIALDPFPYGGTTTTCDAIWMGVPVVTLRGSVHSARVGASLLHGVGLDDLVTESLEDYVDVAVALAEDFPRRRALRSELRSRMRQGHLGDPDRFVPAFEELLRGTWRTYVEGRRAARLPPPGLRRVELGPVVAAMVSADPTSSETFPLLEQGRRWLPGLEAVMCIARLGASLFDLSSDAGEVAACHAEVGGHTTVVRSTPAQVERVLATLAASDLVASVRCVVSSREWLATVPDVSIGALGVVRIDESPKRELRDWLGAILERRLVVLWTLAEGEQGLAVEIVSSVGGRSWVHRPGLDAFSPWTTSETREARTTLLMTTAATASEFAQLGLLVECSYDPRVGSVESLPGVPNQVGAAHRGVEALLRGEDTSLTLRERLDALESAAAGDSTNSVDTRFARTRALVHLGRRSEAASVIEKCLSLMEDRGETAEPALRPLASQDEQTLSGSVAERVEQLTIEAFVKLSAPSSLHHTKDALGLLARYQSLGGPDPEMARRFGLLLAREGLAG
jgi:protein O-GlcNAc transferase